MSAVVGDILQVAGDLSGLVCIIAALVCRADRNRWRTWFYREEQAKITALHVARPRPTLPDPGRTSRSGRKA